MNDRPDPVSAWQAALGRLQLEIPQEQFDTFLRPCSGLRWEDECLVVGAATTFAVSWLELPLHLEMAREAVAKTVGAQSNVRYMAAPARTQNVAGAAGASVQSVVAEPAARFPDLIDTNQDQSQQAPGQRGTGTSIARRLASTPATRSIILSSAKATSWPTTPRAQ